MRVARIFLPLLVALMAAACARQQPNYFAPAAQQYGAPGYAPAQAYAQPSNDHRGLFTSSNAPFAPRPAAPAYARPRPQRSYVLQYHPPRPAAAATKAYASAPRGYDAYAPASQPYTLDSGDKLRVVVFGQQGISGDYLVDAGGHVSLPLVGSVRARGFTTRQLAAMIAERLKQGYVRAPHVTVEVTTYRPFFILGEVTTPGQYPYVPNMTVENAVAIAGGFAPRAKKDEVQLTRNAGDQHYKGDVPLSYPLRPGDTLLVKERWF